MKPASPLSSSNKGFKDMLMAPWSGVLSISSSMPGGGDTLPTKKFVIDKRAVFYEKKRAAMCPEAERNRITRQSRT